MKKSVILVLALFFLPLFGFAQTIENVEFISPFHDEVAAIKKDGKWAFIDMIGQIVIEYRTDLVLTKIDKWEYPIFTDGRCQIVEEKEGISYYGFIDKSGKVIIEPQFLNTTNFINGVAIALKLDRQVIGKNTALDKELVNYRYFEVLINTDGEVTYYLTQDGVNIVLDKDYYESTPEITSKHLADNLYAVPSKNKKISIIKVNPKA